MAAVGHVSAKTDNGLLEYRLRKKEPLQIRPARKKEARTNKCLQSRDLPRALLFLIETTLARPNLRRTAHENVTHGGKIVERGHRLEPRQ